MSKPCPIRSNFHPRLLQARLQQMGTVRLKRFAQQIVAPALAAHLTGLEETLDRTPSTRHAVDFAIARWLQNWREALQPKLVEQAVTALLEDEEILRARRTSSTVSEAFEHVAVRLATAEIDLCLPQLRGRAERLRRARLSVH